MKLVWSREARRDLRAIRRFIARDSDFYATRFVAQLIERTETLLTSPQRGHPVHEYPEEPLKEIHEPPYRIVYQTTEAEIRIITLVHFKQRLKLPRA